MHVDYTYIHFLSTDEIKNISSRIPLDIILKCKDYCWDWELISKRVDLNTPFILELHHKLNLKQVTKTTRILPEFALKHHTLNWDWHDFLSESHLSRIYVVTLINIYEQLISIQDANHKFKKWLHGLSVCAPVEILNKYPDFGWDYKGLDKNFLIRTKVEQISWKFVLHYRHNLKWDWEQLSARPDLTRKLIETHPDLPWVEASFIGNDSFSLDEIIKIIDKNPNIQYNNRTIIEKLSSRKDLTLNFITKYYRFLDIDTLIDNSDLFTLDFVNSHSLSISSKYIQALHIKKEKYTEIMITKKLLFCGLVVDILPPEIVRLVFEYLSA